MNQHYEWEPRIWDPQAASETLNPVFRSPAGTLPPWLHWEDDAKLVGTPTAASGPIPIIAVAEFVDSSGSKCIIETTFNLQVVLPHLMPVTDPAAIYAQVQAQAAMQAHMQQAQGDYAYAQPWGMDPMMQAQQVQQSVVMPM